MQFTTNDSTVTKGECTATCLARTVSPEGGIEIITWELKYPRYIHAELMTHRMFSRNASSSRATPLSVNIEAARFHAPFFSKVGLNQPGMVAEKNLEGDDLERFKAKWYQLGNMVADFVCDLKQEFGIHKQVLNRALEPWLYMHTIVTATEVDNFFKLRLARDAQPEMQDLAQAMLLSVFNQPKREDTWHFPYREQIRSLEIDEKITRNVAACARVCVMKHDGKESTLEQDQALYGKLLEGGHLTPFEHIAQAGNPKSMYANFRGWKSIRWNLENGFEVDG